MSMIDESPADWEARKVKAHKLCATLFKSYDQESKQMIPVNLSPTQLELFSTIVYRATPRNHVMFSTQTGKSFTVSLAVLLRAATFPEKWAIVAPSQPKAMIIMRNVLEHVFDHKLISSQLEIDVKEEKLKRERSKRRLSFKNGGEIFVLSADTKNKAAAGEALVGFGSGNLIIDESSLIEDDIYSKAKRMLGGHKDNFLLEIGNPFYRNHFFRSFHDPEYKKIEMDCWTAIKEGRLQESFVREMSKEANFSVLYENKFPEEDELDADGWSPLFTMGDLDLAFRSGETNVHGSPYLGVDVAGAGDCDTVWVLRHDNHARVIGKASNLTAPEIVGQTIAFAEKYRVDESHIAIDSTGGASIAEFLGEQGWRVRAINMAETALDDERYINTRVELAFRAQKWLKQGGTLERHDGFYQLLDMRYRVRDSCGRFKLISKDELRKRGIASPDVYDAFSLTFPDQLGAPSDVHRKKKVQAVRACKTSFE